MTGLLFTTAELSHREAELFKIIPPRASKLTRNVRVKYANEFCCRNNPGPGIKRIIRRTELSLHSEDRD